MSVIKGCLRADSGKRGSREEGGKGGAFTMEGRAIDLWELAGVH